MKRLLPLISAIVLAAIARGGRAYTLEFDESGDNATPSCLFYPINCRMYAADIAGVRVGLWRENPAKEGILVSNGGAKWNGRRRGNESSLWLFASGRAKAKFRNGRLVSFSRESGGTVDEESDREMLSQEIRLKQRRKALRFKADHKGDGWHYWADSGRLRLWYANPNAAGALFAEIALLGLAMLFFVPHRILRVCGVLLTLASLVMLAFTHSRGGFVAVAVGFIALLLPVVLGVRRRRIRMVILIVGIAAIVSMVVATPLIARWAANRDLGNLRRLSIWKDAPRMMAMAPNGWKTSTGYAWCEWLQPLNEDFTTTWMVNSHLSWLVQYGYVFRLMYMFCWLFVLSYAMARVIMGPESRSKAWAFALSQLVALFAIMWFSTVGPELTLWMVPASAFAVALAVIRKNLCPRTLAGCAAASLAASFAILHATMAMGASAEKCAPLGGMIEVIKNGVKIGRGEIKNYLVHDNIVLTGGHFGVLGKDLREFYAKHPDASATLVVKSPKRIPDDVETLVLAGKAADAYLAKCSKNAELARPRPKRLVLISPNVPWNIVPDFVLRDTNVAYFTGEFAAMCSGLCSNTVPDWVKIVPGCATYVRDWTERSLK